MSVFFEKPTEVTVHDSAPVCLFVYFLH